jgi:hypothetical protein
MSSQRRLNRHAVVASHLDAIRRYIDRIKPPETQGPKTRQGGGPSCNLCNNEEWWQQEFGDDWQSVRCAYCGPGGLECPGVCVG